MSPVFLSVGRSAWNSASGIAYLAIAALALNCMPCLVLSLIASEPGQLLAQAEQLADVYNWYDAQPALRRGGEWFQSRRR